MHLNSAFKYKVSERAIFPSLEKSWLFIWKASPLLYEHCLQGVVQQCQIYKQVSEFDAETLGATAVFEGQ